MADRSETRTPRPAGERLREGAVEQRETASLFSQPGNADPLGDEHTQWLARMRAESEAKQKSFIGGISARLGRGLPDAAPVHPFRGSPDFWQAYEWDERERIARFAANFQAVGGHVVRLNGMAEAADFIAGKALELSAKYIVRNDEPELAALGLEAAIPGASVSVWNTDAAEHWKARAAEADIGVVMADYAAAYTGSITVLSSARKGRTVSLLPTVLVAIIPLDRLRTRLGEILTGFDQAGRERLPAGIHFISGPSRSADIENDLTIGVHGPGIVYALLVG